MSDITTAPDSPDIPDPNASALADLAEFTADHLSLISDSADRTSSLADRFTLNPAAPGDPHTILAHRVIAGLSRLENLLVKSAAELTRLESLL